VLNLCDTGYRNCPAHELHVPAILEVFGVPYTGSPPACLGMCFDKAIVSAIATDCGIPVPEQRFLAAGDDAGDIEISYPALVKPNRADGGVGITARSVVANRSELLACVARLRRELVGQSLLVQQYLSGEEYGIGLVGNLEDGFTVLPVLEVDWRGLPAALPRILGYESKTLPDSPYWTQLKFRPARLDGAQRARMEHSARILFERLGCRDYARFDFRAGDDGVVRFLEVNPNPAWCWDGKFNLMATLDGMSYSELFWAILDAAQRRVSRRR
jgi:D-alanine-D-alanine ligase